MKRAVVGVVVGVLVTQGCTDVAKIPVGPAAVASTGRFANEGECVPDETQLQPCPDEDAVVYTPHSFGGGPFGYVNDIVYEAPNDPNSGSPGIWLGPSVSPSTCFSDLGASIVDSDRDWLDDNCEFHLAKAFAPTMSFHWDEVCGEGEPVWAAKYFPVQPQRLIRIAYLPAYYKDCGGDLIDDDNNIKQHFGDAELVMVQVIFNGGTQHWEFERMWTSAHYGFPNDQSEWSTRDGAQFSRRVWGHPLVYVARHKHANYRSYSACYYAWNTLDVCKVEPNAGRFPVVGGRNIGSLHTPNFTCIESIVRYAGSGKLECFYQVDQPFGLFCGWRSNVNNCSADYRETLIRPHYDVYSGSYTGPGPAPFGPPTPPDEPPNPPVGCEPPECEPETLRAAPALPKRNGPKAATTANPGLPSAKPAPRVVSGRQ